jgi:hypothetical protein
MFKVTPPTTPKGSTVKVIVATEVWTVNGKAVAKAVVRKTDGTFVGATNQTKPIEAAKIVRPRVVIVGR